MFERLEALIGSKNLKKLAQTKVLVLGCGGVGGFVIEGLVRSGIGCLTVVDKDVVEETNLNRQIIALNSTIGEYKADLVVNRAKDINPEVKIDAIKRVLTPESLGELNLSEYDYIVDAIDDVKVKVELARVAIRNNLSLVIATGTAKKLHPEALHMTRLDKTSYDPLARKMRTLLKGEKINRLVCLASKENPIKTEGNVLGSSAFVPSVGGLMIAGYIVNDIIDNK